VAVAANLTLLYVGIAADRQAIPLAERVTDKSDNSVCLVGQGESAPYIPPPAIQLKTGYVGAAGSNYGDDRLNIVSGNDG
jgi:hypothetical protein